MFKSLIAATLLTSAASVGAVTLDVVSSFGTAHSPFSFGTETAGVFSPAPAFQADNCVGVSGLACYNTPGSDYTFPAVGKNVSRNDPLNFYTNVLPKNMLFVQSNPNAPAIIQFTAPVTAVYTLKSTFTRIDTSNGAGDGVLVDVEGPLFGGGGQLGQTYQDASSLTISGILTAGQTTDYGVFAQGNTFNDGTGFQLTVTYVPEPASWALMIAGFALTGIAARRRHAAVV